MVMEATGTVDLRLGDNRVIHGLSIGGDISPEYRAWRAARSRCSPNNKRHRKDYFERGITFDPAWNNVLVFLKDMGPRPANCTSIDRINNDLGYTKGNCRWATPKQQARNRRSTRFLTLNGITLSLPEWSEKIGIAADTIAHRMDSHGWSIEEALTRPLRGTKNDLPETATYSAVATSN